LGKIYLGRLCMNGHPWLLYRSSIPCHCTSCCFLIYEYTCTIKTRVRRVRYFILAGYLTLECFLHFPLFWPFWEERRCHYQSNTIFSYYFCSFGRENFLKYRTYCGLCDQAPRSLMRENRYTEWFWLANFKKMKSAGKSVKLINLPKCKWKLKEGIVKKSFFGKQMRKRQRR